MVNNFDIISEMLDFREKDDFYFLQIIQRKKDGCDVNDSGSNGYRRVKTYYIRSVEDLKKRRDKIIELCKNNNARAYIHLNPRSAREVALTAAKAYIDLVREDRCEQGHRVYDHVCGTTPKAGIDKMWIVDADNLSRAQLTVLCGKINTCRSSYRVKDDHYDNVLARIPTVHGYHIITHGFDVSNLRNILSQSAYLELTEEQIKEILNVKKDSPTLLYYYSNKECTEKKTT